jgi:phytoene dehydrogenase-like protein
MAEIMGDRFSGRVASKLRGYPYGPGVFKVDWALDGPIPWKAKECLDAATVHVGGTFDEIAAAESAPWRDEHAERPFVLVTQPTVVDRSRAPAGKHTAWGYCHVPNGSTFDMTARIEAQVERFAPGFRDVILARAIRSPSTIEDDNANLVGGDVSGGSNDLWNLIFRPTWRRYATPVPGVFLCSAATPPGGGVHGMCGYHAAHAAFDGDSHGR